MTKAEIREVLDNTLSKSELGKIKNLVRVLGSASIKTAVLVELMDGTYTVAIVKSPKAEKQTLTHLKYAKLYMQELEAEGLTSGSHLTRQAIAALEHQILPELDLINEVAQTRKARATYQKIEKEMGDKMDGWHFEVPDINDKDFEVRSGVYFMDFADGKSLREFEDGADKKKAESLFGESVVRSIFDHGLVNPDPHRGNVKMKVDGDRKVIYPLDFGQQVELENSALPWRADDRYQIARLAQAVSNSDFELLEKTISHLAPATKWTPEVREDLKGVFDTHTEPAERILPVLEALAAHGIELPHRFFFGAVKALLTNAAEKYLTDQDFKSTMEAASHRALKRKLPVFMGESLSRACRNAMKTLGM